VCLEVLDILLNLGGGSELLPVSGHLGDREPGVKPTSTEVGFYFKKRKMSQICNFFPRNFVTFQDLKMYTFTIAGVSACGKEALTTSAVIPEVDWVIGYSDNPKHRRS
jgi:hypothetical protein